MSTTQKELRSLSPFRGKQKDIFSFKRDDFYWFSKEQKNSNLVNDEDYKNVPYLIINEFQPDYAVNMGDLSDFYWKTAGGLAKEGANLLGATAGALAGVKVGGFGLGDNMTKLASSVVGGGAATVVAATENVASTGLRIGGEQKVNDIISNVESAGNDPNKNPLLLDNPINFVRNMISGKYIKKFIVPYFGEDYIHASGDGWKSSGMEKVIGPTLKKWISNAMPMEFPGVPEWSNENGGNDCPEIKVEIDLFNTDIDSASKNFIFLNAITAGAYWLQIDRIQKSPNLYTIECPGRFYYYYCKLNLDIKTYGKNRIVSEEIKTFIKENSFVGRDFFIPDVWHVTMSLKSLMPNNFNMYVAYALNKLDNITVGITSVKKTSTFEKAVDGTLAATGGLAESAVSGVGAIAAAAFKAMAAETYKVKNKLGW